MRYQDAQKLQIIDILERMGVQKAGERIHSKSGLQYFYNSPFRQDNNPSFYVTLDKNLYYDQATGEGGNVKNFLALCSGSDRDDIKSGLAWADTLGITAISLFNPPPKMSPTSTEKKVMATLSFIGEKPLFYYPLKNYIKERGISFEIANKYLKEIVFKNNKQNATYSAIGFKSGDCWELRKKKFKGTLGTGKDITIFEKMTPGILIFTGVFDFLSYLEAKKIIEPDKTVIVLNSDRFIKRAVDYINKNEVKTVEYFKDNDTSGELTLKEMEQCKAHVVDKSYAYANYKDLNEWLIAEKQGL